MKRLLVQSGSFNPIQIFKQEILQFYSRHYRRSSHCASVGLKHRVHGDLSNLPQLLRQKRKFDIPLLYKGYLPPAGLRSVSVFFKGEEKSLPHTCTRFKPWGKGKRKELNLTHFPADNAKR